MGIGRRIALVTAATAVALTVGAAPASADVEDFSFRSLTVDYYLEQLDSGRARLAVVETWVAEFPEIDQNRGIVRAIPERDGYKHLGVLVEDVLDENGDPVEWSYGDGNSRTEVIEIDDDEFKHGVHTYVIRYSMRDVIRGFEEGDEFFPDVNGTEWEQPIGSVTARLHLRQELADSLDGRRACFTGSSGSSAADCDISTDTGSTKDWPALLVLGLDVDETEDGDYVVIEDEPTTIITVSTGALGPGENLSFDVGFAPGTFVQPETPAMVGIAPWIGAGSLLLPLGLAIAGLVGRARAAARLPKPRIVQYTAPRGISIRLSSVVLDAQSKTLAAHLIDLAVRTLVVIGTAGSTRDTKPGSYAISRGSGDGATSDDGLLLGAMFGSGQGAVRLDKLSTKRQKALTSYREKSVDAAKDAGLVARSVSWYSNLTVALMIVGILVAVALFVMAGMGYLPVWATVLIVVGLAGLFVLSFVVAPPTVELTPRGHELRQYLLGIRDYIRLAEADRLRYLQSPTTAETRRDVGFVQPEDEPTGADGEQWRVLHLYERLLPYAVLFGLEKKWSTVLSDVGRDLPEALPDTSALIYQAAAVSSFSSALHSASHYSDPVSGGGGSSGFSSGGGFSGGGFGGGGGGGR
jgi:uncharacterized membrane protein YgcG